jgi:SEC-C motif
LPTKCWCLKLTFSSPESARPKDPRFRPQRNEPCHCGSGKKYKKCHLSADQASDRAELEANLGELPPPHTHPEHALCQAYWPHSTGVPAHLRRDFNQVIREMRSSGATLLHVFAPAALAKDEVNYQKSLQILADNGITVDFEADPKAKEIVAAQAYFDRIFGERVYQVRPTSASLRDYPHSSRRASLNGGTQLCVPRKAGLGHCLWTTKADEWRKMGMPQHPDLLNRAALGADLVTDLFNSCTDLASLNELEDDDAWGGMRKLLHEIFVLSAGGAQPEREHAPPYPLSARLAFGLAFPASQNRSGDSFLQALPVSEGSIELLISLAAELRGDKVAQDLLAIAPTSWMTLVGLKAWYAAVPVHLREEAGLPVVIDELDDAQQELGATTSTSSAAAATDVTDFTSAPPVGSEAVVDIFHPLDEIALSAQDATSELRDRIRGRLVAANELSAEIGAYRQQIVEKEAELKVLERAIQALEDEVDSLLETDRHARTAALFGILARGQDALQGAVLRWREHREERDRLARDLTPEQQDQARLLSSYSETVRTGALDGLDATLRNVLEEQARRARESLGSDWELRGENSAVHAVVPIALGLSVGEGRIRVSAGFPFDATTAGALPVDSPDTVLAAVTTHQMASMLHELGIPGGDRDVDAQAVQGQVTLLSMEAEYTGDEDLSDYEATYTLYCQEAADQDELLRRAGVTARFRAVPAELIDDVATAAEEGL